MSRERQFTLPSNDGNECPQTLLFIDTECVSKNMKKDGSVRSLSFLLACCELHMFSSGKYHLKESTVHYSSNDFWDYVDSLCNPKKPITVIAHNAGFDMTILDLWHEIESGRYTIRGNRVAEDRKHYHEAKQRNGCLIVDGHPFIVTMFGHTGRIRILDSGNWFGGSLKELGRTIGVEKYDFPGFNAPFSDMETYCKRDVEIVAKAVTGAICKWKGFDGGVWKSTVSGLALTSLQHFVNANKKDRGIDDMYFGDNREWSKDEREAYYGGQTQAFFVGGIGKDYKEQIVEEPASSMVVGEDMHNAFYHIDINSLYPSIMASVPLPVRRHLKYVRPSVNMTRDILRGFGGIARVYIKDDFNEYPCRRGKKLLITKGSFTTWLAGSELKRAIDSNSIESVDILYSYTMGNTLKHWAEHWYKYRIECRRNADAIGESLAKGVMNSLSGKFAQNGKFWVDLPDERAKRECGIWYEYNVDGGELRKYRNVAGFVQEEVEGVDKWFTFPAVSAFITAEGRERMRHARHAAGTFNVVYQATDSLIVNSKGYDNLIVSEYVKPETLGRFKLLGVYSKGEIRAANSYRLGDNYTHSGIPHDAETDENGYVTYDVFECVDSMLSRGYDGTILVSKVTAKLRREPLSMDKLEGGFKTFGTIHEPKVW